MEGGNTMQITDPIADMLTRIRNANDAKHETVDIPNSNMKKAKLSIYIRVERLLYMMMIKK